VNEKVPLAPVAVSVLSVIVPLPNVKFAFHCSSFGSVLLV
jgi:hypothetical protein